MSQDLRYGIRMLLKTPGFSFFALLTLALGIGANTAVFTVLNAALLKPLPFPNPEQILEIQERHPNLADLNVTGASSVIYVMKIGFFPRLPVFGFFP